MLLAQHAGTVVGLCVRPHYSFVKNIYLTDFEPDRDPMSTIYTVDFDRPSSMEKSPPRVREPIVQKLAAANVVDAGCRTSLTVTHMALARQA